MKDRHAQDVVYALADYKQLVMAYRTKQAELVRSAALWKSSTLWLASVALLGLAILAGWGLSNDRALRRALDDARVAAVRAEALSERLRIAETDLASVRQELADREAMIGLLEKNISTASKKLVEQLLADDGLDAAPATKGASP